MTRPHRAVVLQAAGGRVCVFPTQALDVTNGWPVNTRPAMPASN